MQKYIKNIFFVLVCLSLTAPLWVFQDMLFPFVTSKAFFFRICVEVAFPFYVYLVLANANLRPNLKNPLTLSVLAFLAINLASSFSGVGVIRSLWGNFERMGGAFYLAHLVALYFYVLLLGQLQGRYLQRFLKVLMGVAVIIVLYGLGNYAGLLKPVLAFFHLSSLYLTDPSLPSRISSTLGNPIYVGSFLIIPLFLVLFLSFQAQSVYAKITYNFFSFLFLAGIFLSGTRGAWLGLIGGCFIGMVVYLFLSSHKKIKVYGFVTIGILVAACAGLFVFNNKLPQGSTIKRVFTLNDSNAQARLIQWKIALSGYKDRPILGTGPENYYVVGNKYYNPEIAQYDRSWFDKPHNYILEILVTNGALGLLAYLAMIIFMVAAFYRGYKSGFYSLAEFCLLLAALLAYQIQNLTVFDTVPASLMFYGFFGFAGYVSVIASSDETHEKKKHNVRVHQSSALPAAGFSVALIVMAYSVYATEIVPMRIAKNINYGYAYAGVDVRKAFNYFKAAVDLPFNFDKTETAGKLAGFAGNFVRGASVDQQGLALEVLDSATAYMQEALLAQPDYPILWQEAASLYLFRSSQLGGKVSVNPKAEAAIKKAIDLAPKRTEGYLFLAQIRGLEANYAEAEKILQTLLENYPNDFSIKAQLANTYRVQNKTESAAELMEQALSQGHVFPSYEEAKWLIGFYVLNKNFDKAIALLQEMGKVEPGNLQLFVDLARLYAQAGQKDLARTLAENIIQVDPARTKEMQELIDSLK